MANDQKDQEWRDGACEGDRIMRADDGEDMAHVFQRDGYPGQFVLMTRDHGEDWGQKPAFYGTKLECQHHATTHAKEYALQEERNLSEAGHHHTINSLEKEWKEMGGDPKTMNEFKKEWDRVSAAEHNLKVPDRDTDRDREGRG